jgi:beta-lactamase class A
MDGVRSTRPVGMAVVNAVDANEASTVPRRPSASVPIDGPYRLIHAAAANSQTGTLEQDESQSDQTYATAAGPRSRWSALAATAVLLPVLILPMRYYWNSQSEAPLVSSANSRGGSVSLAPTSTVAAPVTEPAVDPALDLMLQQFTAAKAVPHGIVIKDLKTGTMSASSPEHVFTSASLYKLFVAHGIYKQIDNGGLTLGTPVRGTGRNVGDCLRIMINVSDNACGRALGTILGWGKQDAVLRDLGFKHTSLADPLQTSAGDVALLLERLYKGSLLSPSSSDHFMTFLKEQRVNNRLPAGLPAGTAIAHKTGDLDGYVHDAGIVFGPKTDYLVVVASGRWQRPAEAPAGFGDLSARLYAHFNQ